MWWFRRRDRAPLRATSSLSLRWRVMLLAMSMVAMVVVLMSFAVYAVISAALYSDIDNQLQSRAQLLIASGSLAADPGKAIEGTAYSDVNAMLVNPGQSIYTAQQPGQTLPVGAAEKAVIRGELFMSRRTTADQRVLAIRLTNGSSLLISKSLKPTEAVMNKLRWVLLIVGGIGVAVAAVAVTAGLPGPVDPVRAVADQWAPGQRLNGCVDRIEHVLQRCCAGRFGDRVGAASLA